MELSERRIDHYLSLFFIPLFRIKKGVPFFLCGNCGVHFKEDGTLLQSDPADVKRECRFCGRRQDSGFIFCPYCGKRL